MLLELFALIWFSFLYSFITSFEVIGTSNIKEYKSRYLYKLLATIKVTYPREQMSD